MLAFLVIMIFFDANNFFQIARLMNRKAELMKDKAYFINEIQETRKSLEELEENDFLREKYAREHHFLKRNQEDVYVFIEKSTP
jgi:cell division protein DivIC